MILQESASGWLHRFWNDTYFSFSLSHCHSERSEESLNCGKNRTRRT